MIEKVIDFKISEEKTIEKLVTTNDLNLNHVILPSGEGLPEHYANANVHLVIVKGVLSAKFNDQDLTEYKAGQVINVDDQTKMNVSNQNDEVLDFFIIKAPGPIY